MIEASVNEETARKQGKSASAFRTISEVAAELDVPAHVLRFWESKFSHVRPLKRGGGRRYYRPEDVDLLRGIRELLYTDGYTIKGVQKLLRESGGKALAQSVSDGDDLLGLDPPDEPVAAPAPPNPGNGSAAAKPALQALPPETKRELTEILRELESLKQALAKLL